jgi:rhamnopyranosyl-N-acetylglucosaminyl-diphospho-decaprenol beta-1,3/1,4-galactofuranosyltransferase
MRVGAGVVTFNRPDGLARTLDGLRAQSHSLDSLIVVNNGDPIDATPDVVVIDPGENLGPAGGFAAVLAYAVDLALDWVFLINDGDRPREQTIEQLVCRVERDSDPAHLGAVMGFAITASGVVRKFGARWHRGLRWLSEEEKSGDEYECDATSFTGMLVNVRAAAAVGGVDGRYFLMWEEFDFCLRLRRAGHRIVTVSEVFVELEESHDQDDAYPPWRGYYQARNGVLAIRRLGLWSGLPWHLWRMAKMTAASVRLDHSARRAGLRLRGLLDGVFNRDGRTVEPG